LTKLDEAVAQPPSNAAVVADLIEELDAALSEAECCMEAQRFRPHR